MTRQAAESKRYSGAGSLSALVQAQHRRIVLLEWGLALARYQVDTSGRELAAARLVADRLRRLAGVVSRHK